MILPFSRGGDGEVEAYVVDDEVVMLIVAVVIIF